MTKYKTYREVRNTFSAESQKRITARAEQIKEELRIQQKIIDYLSQYNRHSARQIVSLGVVHNNGK